MKKIIRLMLALAILIVKTVVVFVIIGCINEATQFIFEYKFFMHDWGLNGLIYAGTLVTLLDAISYNYEDIEEVKEDE